MRSAADLTVTGQILGTPSYMSPEQAGASSGQTSPSSNIYSLGAILYQLLTGRPPFHGATMLEVVEQVRSQDPPSPRSLHPSVPRDLETICLHCLEKIPARRYESAEHLADDLRRFLELSPIKARPSGLFERGWKHIARRPVVSALLATVALSCFGGAVGIVWQAHKANRYAERASAERDHAQRLNRQAVFERDQADAWRDESQRNFQRAFDVVDNVRRVGAKLHQTPETATTGLELLQLSLDFYSGFLDEGIQSPEVRAAAATAFANAGDIAAQLGRRQEAVEHYRTAIGLRQRFVDESPRESAPRRELAIVWRKLGNTRRHQDHFAEAEAAYKTATAQYELALELEPDADEIRVSLANTLLNCAASYVDHNRFAAALEHYRRSETLLRDAEKRLDSVRHLAELALCLDDFGRLAWRMGDEEFGERALREALEIRKRVVAASRRSLDARQLLARSHLNLAIVERHLREWEKAAAHCRQAKELTQNLAAANPHRLDLQQEYPRVIRMQALLA